MHPRGNARRTTRNQHQARGLAGRRLGGDSSEHLLRPALAGPDRSQPGSRAGRTLTGHDRDPGRLSPGLILVVPLGDLINRRVLIVPKCSVRLLPIGTARPADRVPGARPSTGLPGPEHRAFANRIRHWRSRGSGLRQRGWWPGSGRIGSCADLQFFSSAFTHSPGGPRWRAWASSNASTLHNADPTSVCSPDHGAAGSAPQYSATPLTGTR